MKLVAHWKNAFLKRKFSECANYKYRLQYPQNQIFWFLVNIYNFCVYVFEKTISCTKMIDHSFERYYNGVCYRLYKNIVRGTAARGARLKLKNCGLTMMLSTSRYKNHSRVFSRSSLTSVEVSKCYSIHIRRYWSNKIRVKYI